LGVRGLAVVAVVASWLLAPGCGSPITIKEIDEETWFKRENQSALDSDEPSERTRQFLRREALLADWKKDPREVMRGLETRLLDRRERLVALHLAELAFLEAKRHRDEKAQEPGMLFTCAEHAWAALFDPQLVPPLSDYDPGFRLACDLYNRSIAWLLRYAAANRPVPPHPWDTLQGTVTVSLDHSDYAWDPRDYEELVVAYDLDVTGLPVSARSFGIGVPTILTRATTTLETSDPKAAGLIQNVYGATVLLRFEGSIVDRATNPDRAAHLDVYDPLQTTTVNVAGREIPLEADLSTTLAYTLTKTEEYSGFTAMFQPERYRNVTRLLMLEPYQPDKIPVVFVHGLMSSPMTWMPLLNDLLADPVIRERFQFWFFRYSTGNPVLYSAELLRAALAENQRRFDPQGTNPCMNDMVMVAHSMGGLLARVQVNSSEDRIWKLFSDESFDDFVKELELEPEQAEALRRSLFFERLPFITRVVFMATPHRGADLAVNPIVEWCTNLIELPANLATALGSAVKKGQRFFRAAQREQVTERLESASGIAGLAPDNIAQESISKWPFPDGLAIHSIIGNDEGTDPTGTDGVVPYTSSHLDAVLSEKVIHSGHNVQTHAEALLELRRILLLHLTEFDARHPAGPAPAPTPGN
jgi:triacylglycerol esterase/lipase EstA (alpha/beta hydrolase family)